jgi:hypothetical protein
LRPLALRISEPAESSAFGGAEEAPSLTAAARDVTQTTLDEVRNALGLFQLNADPDFF